ncbi:MAG: hypothetical protein R2932_39975 [Caldilineaceae bacterium]
MDARPGSVVVREMVAVAVIVVGIGGVVVALPSALGVNLAVAVTSKVVLISPAAPTAAGSVTVPVASKAAAAAVSAMSVVAVTSSVG